MRFEVCCLSLARGRRVTKRAHGRRTPAFRRISRPAQAAPQPWHALQHIPDRRLHRTCGEGLKRPGSQAAAAQDIGPNAQQDDPVPGLGDAKVLGAHNVPGHAPARIGDEGQDMVVVGLPASGPQIGHDPGDHADAVDLCRKHALHIFHHERDGLELFKDADVFAVQEMAVIGGGVVIGDPPVSRPADERICLAGRSADQDGPVSGIFTYFPESRTKPFPRAVTAKFQHGGLADSGLPLGGMQVDQPLTRNPSRDVVIIADRQLGELAGERAQPQCGESGRFLFHREGYVENALASCVAQ